MKKSEMIKKALVCGFGIIIGSVSIVCAGEAIQASLNNEIKISLNGKVQSFVDETTGEKQFPITYKNRTYLPLRNVANLAGLEVNYNEKTNTAELTKEEKQSTVITDDSIIRDVGVAVTLYSKPGSPMSNKKVIYLLPSINDEELKEIDEYISTLEQSDEINVDQAWVSQIAINYHGQLSIAMNEENADMCGLIGSDKVVKSYKIPEGLRAWAENVLNNF